MDMNKIIGSWKLLEADPSLDLGENDEMYFSEDGDLLYAIDAGSKWQILKLTYTVENETLITDQPSSPDEQRTKFTIENENLLVLDYDGALAKYKRINECSFRV
jgi:hypothetical protein